ncbi:DNA-directed RNA polymerase subunit alpha [Marinitoga sp. 1135]|uniref:DNA-directed RNA polymerase subunit alpha n=1 Tax=Marinitoga piezophila (strain DSM 14283 / JCM 11233 / KA3) TaxID=443254 RepID=H2J776_MARPK|nr:MULTISPECIES: DNA-directed RNA polymerase subunit alpha [Marinitoga]AEX85268.1 DNA-directed RNA polymerase, alpha subunit [Marinitoga piezophila KA3]APT75753.1 DNA-directed RNA polymerase subunit alpha [Marinitoga sp. 1137]NUU95496.1 DNA-directed RNA polymerase subunit alpha [Marinitoga sp. 1135]NUU97423.1 DNA-directed RNA polymerase subunit alpha [Marinitoga sp. 1138]
MEFVKPEKMILETLEESEELEYKYGRFVLSPLERGYAVTIGNALRRVLLSSIPGLAITSIRIPGKLHEFDVIEGVQEDILEITVNLKKVELKVVDFDNIGNLKEPIVLRIEKMGPAEIKAGDIITPPGIEIANPDFKIATMNANKKFEMELYATVGKGFVSTSEMDLSKDIEMIYIDGVYSPVIRVNYLTEKVRVGKRTDYDKLILEVWTKKSIDPKEALVKATKILIEHFNIIYSSWREEIDLTEAEAIPESMETNVSEEIAGQEVEEEFKNVSLEVLETRIDELDLSKRAKNCLKREKINTVRDILKKDPDELMKIKNFGKKSLDEIRKELKEKFQLDYDEIQKGGA